MTISKTNVLVSCGGSAQDILYHTSSLAQQEGKNEKKNKKQKKNEVCGGRHMKLLEVRCQMKRYVISASYAKTIREQLVQPCLLVLQARWLTL